MQKTPVGLGAAALEGDDVGGVRRAEGFTIERQLFHDNFFGIPGGFRIPGGTAIIFSIT